MWNEYVCCEPWHLTFFYCLTLIYSIPDQKEKRGYNEIIINIDISLNNVTTLLYSSWRVDLHFFPLLHHAIFLKCSYILKLEETDQDEMSDSRLPKKTITKNHTTYTHNKDDIVRVKWSYNEIQAIVIITIFHILSASFLLQQSKNFFPISSLW